MIERYGLIMLGAGLGGVARAALATWVMSRVGGRFPLGTFVVNVSGCFLIGILMTLLTVRYPAHPYWRLFLVVGFLGGYTTFSSFEYETLVSANAGDRLLALLNLAGSVLVGYAATWAGVLLAAKR